MNALIPYAAGASSAIFPYIRKNIKHVPWMDLAKRIKLPKRSRKYRKRQAQRRFQRITARRMRPRLTVPRWAGRDIRILRKATVCLQNMGVANENSNTQTTTQSFQRITNDSANYEPILLETVRSYYNDKPFFFNVSEFIQNTAQPLLNQDAKQNSVDIQSVTFFLTFINYQPDVDMFIRTMLLRKSDKDDIPSGNEYHQGVSKNSFLSFDDFWNDTVDKDEKHDFTTQFDALNYSPNYKDYASPNKAKYKVWTQKNITIKSNPHTHGTKFFPGQNANGTDVNQQGTLEQDDPHLDNDVGNEYVPNQTAEGNNITGNAWVPGVMHDMAVTRIRGYPGQNEKSMVVTWKPKGGYRFQFIKKDADPETNVEPHVPKDDLRFLIMPFEITKDPRRKATRHALGYRMEVTIKYKDLL
jgi:hypothetical protein